MAWIRTPYADTLTPRIQTDADGSGRVSTETIRAGNWGGLRGSNP